MGVLCCHGRLLIIHTLLSHIRMHLQAVFGLLVGGGLNSGNANVGDPFLRLQQRLTHAIGTFGRSWSFEVDIPRWWASKARGADPTDM